jgi:peptidoglycan/LPS O-acetylase OafA/YrhL
LLLLGAATALLWPPFVFEIETPFVHTYGLTLVYLGSGLLLVAALGSMPTGRWAGPVAYAGSRSYSIYLWHMPVAAWIAPRVAEDARRP